MFITIAAILSLIMEADSVSEETEQSSTMVEKGLPGLQMKFEDSKLTFNPEYHEEALHDKISLICSGRKVIKENGINFSEDKQCVYIEIEDIEGKHSLVRFHAKL